MTTLQEAALTGDRMESLRVLRDILARQIDCCESARDLAALSNRFADTLAAIDELSHGTKAPGPPSTVDEFTTRRKKRGA